jgi:hypothetical protein
MLTTLATTEGRFKATRAEDAEASQALQEDKRCTRRQDRSAMHTYACNREQEEK